MTIVELTRRLNITYIYNILPFVYCFYPNPDYIEKADFWTDTFGITETQSTLRVFVKDLFRAPNTQYYEETTQQDCIDTEGTWYWDNDAQLCYVHMEHDYSPIGSPLTCGKATGFTDVKAIYIGDIEYKPLVISTPRANQSEDLQNYDIPSYITGAIDFNNCDGEIDYLINDDIFGNTIDIYSLINTNALNYERTDLTQVASLYVEDYDIAVDRVSIRIQDKRKSQNITIPTELFTIEDYPDMEEDLLGTPIPVLWGTCPWVPAVCTNGNLISGDVTYRLATELTAFGFGAYVLQTDGSLLGATALSKTLATGEFVMDASDARDGSGNAMQCFFANVSGIAITKLSDVIIDLNTKYLNKPYNDTYYNTTEWEAEDDNISTGVYYLAEQKLLYEAITEIQNGANIGFRYEIAADGRMTIREDDEDRAVIKTISNKEILNLDTLTISTDSSTLIALSSIGYYYEYLYDTHKRYIYDSLADTVEATYRQRPRYPSKGDLPTLLLTEALAQQKAEFLADRFSTIRGIVTLELAGYQDMRIFDIYYAELIPARFIDGSTITGRQFYGIRKIKIIEVDPDTKNVTNSVKAVIID